MGLRFISTRKLFLCLTLSVGLLSTERAPAQAPGGSSATPSDVAHDPLKLMRLIVWLNGEQRWDDAIAAAKQLLALREAQVGPNHADTAMALDLLGALHRSKQDYPQSKGYFTRSLLVHRKVDGPQSAAVATALVNLGVVSRAVGDSAQALALYEQAKELTEQRAGPDDPALISILKMIDQIYRDRSDYPRLDSLRQRSLALELKAHGPASPEVVLAYEALGVNRESLQDLPGAESYYQRALASAQQIRPASIERVADALFRLGLVSRQQGKLDAASDAFQRSCALYLQDSPVDEVGAARCFGKLGGTEHERGHYRESEAAFAESLTRYERAGKTNTDDYASALANQAIGLQDLGDFKSAEAKFQQALRIVQSLPDKDDARLATTLGNLAGLYLERAEYPLAEPLYAQALTLREAHPEDRGAWAVALQDLALLHAKQGQIASAEAGYTRALDVLRNGAPIETIQTLDAAQIMGNFASLEQDRAQYEHSRQLNERALAIEEHLLGPNHPTIAHRLNNLGDLHKQLGEFEQAEAMYSRAQQLWAAALGEEHPLVATALNNLGTLAEARGDYRRADALLTRALELNRKSQGEAHPDTATGLNNLGQLALVQGDYAKAERFYEQALAVWEKALGPDHPQVALALNNLGSVYAARGEEQRARQALARASAISKQQDETLAFAMSALNLASSYDRANDLARAEPLCESALRVLEAKLGPDHALVATALNQLASIRLARGDLSGSEALVRRAIGIAAGPGGNPADQARYLAGLATVLTDQGKYDEVEQLLGQAAGLAASALGESHPVVGAIALKQGLLAWAKGDPARAVERMKSGLDVAELHVSHTLATGSEQQRRLFLDMSEVESNQAISLHARAFPRDAAAMRLALLSVLRRKGRVLDAVSGSVHTLREHLSPEARALFDELTDVRSRLAQRALIPAPTGSASLEYRQASSALEQRANQLEEQISARSSAFKVLTQPVTLERVAAAIPHDAALLELVSYLPFDVRATADRQWSKRRYAAYVLDALGKVSYADLGESAPIDRVIAQFRTALADPTADARAPGRDLDERVMQPIRPLLGDTRRLLIAPDGELNLVPFAALVDPRGRFLVDDWSFSYLSSGRDLSKGARERARTAPLVVANPDFGPLSAAPAPPRAQSAAFDLRDYVFEPLQETEREGQTVASTLPGALLLSGAAATTERVTELKGPRVLHIATHGFFLADAASGAEAERAIQRVRVQDTGPAVLPENPLLRAGLAFASANLNQGEKHNGILTALEASSLDLWGTQLVVLSACDTGVGEVRTGEGVYGLRRAFNLAGAESLVMSLWRVNDNATRLLMGDYYQRLARGEGRAQALRSAQLALSRSPEQRHPYYWASFVAYGDDTPLERGGELPPALVSGQLTHVPLSALPPSPAVRGCGCRLAAQGGLESSPNRHTAWLSFVMVWLMRRRARARVLQRRAGRARA